MSGRPPACAALITASRTAWGVPRAVSCTGCMLMVLGLRRCEWSGCVLVVVAVLVLVLVLLVDLFVLLVPVAVVLVVVVLVVVGLELTPSSNRG